ncbi:MAG: peptidoglycan DD-metalloendopeptidase family protein [Sulfuritalea sp.]|nr:peptidoglycan DD-metalloendopeptidase family protein [Sulfuritalea sp.]
MNAARLILVLLLLMLGGCASNVSAPVVDRVVVSPSVKPEATAPRADYHTVKKGETLYSISLDHGYDHKDVAAWNKLDNPNVLKIGQQLRVVPPEDGAPVAVVKPVKSSAPVEVKSAAVSAPVNTGSLKREPKGGKLAYSEEALNVARQRTQAGTPAEAKTEVKTDNSATEKPVTATDDVEWIWPANGKLIAPFSEGGSKGLDIAGQAGDPVVAASGGVVSYAGAGLRGYGNLVVLRHNASFLSVYAHNSKILVKEKQTVTKGQKIAEMGSTDAESPRLHFEIRRQGKPADPQKYLPAR